MEKPSLDRDSLWFSQARRLERGMEFVAQFQANKVSNPSEGLRYYEVTLTIDPVSKHAHNDGRWQLTENRDYSGPKDKLRVLERELRDQFIKTRAWEILSERKPDPNFIVDETGEVLERPRPINRRL